ncbi:hypothetical protein [Lachnoclostridium sp. An181]|uniref:hypothetical protein n=1 Tax=Lachnoclostridium sp. An181 TaxID=1965575 RepID=UPI001FA87034|nr:hypothetical protein [Lachnoclostridium sp. An181]
MKKGFMKIWILCLITVVLAVCVSCAKQKETKELSKIESSKVEEIRRTGSSGGKEGESEYFLTDSEKDDFLELLNKVELGDQVDKNKGLSSGAATYYSLQFSDGESLEISPGLYFKIDDQYYNFENYDALWNEFIKFNSIKR